MRSKIAGLCMTDQKAFLRTLGKRLADVRREQGLTQGQLAERSQCSQQSIAEYESGRLNIPVGRLADIADALGVDMCDLVKDSGSGSRKRGPASRIEQLANQVTKLPRTRQRFVVAMLENALQAR